MVGKGVIIFKVGNQFYMFWIFQSVEHYQSVIKPKSKIYMWIAAFIYTTRGILAILIKNTPQ